MKVVIDFRIHNNSGIGTYIKNIIPFLIDYFEVVLLAKDTEVKDYLFYDKVQVINFESPIYSIKEQFEFSKKIPKSDIFWSPHYNIPILPIKAKKRIVTIHDVFHLVFSDILSIKQKLYAKLIINKAIQKSDIILTVSEFSKNEIIKYTNTKKNVNVVYNAIDSKKFKKIYNKAVFDDIKKKYKLPKDFILYVGNVKPHKNLKKLLLAIKNLKYFLVIVGKKEGFITGDNEISEILKKYNIDKRIIFTGYVEDKDIEFIYNLAKIFVFPSLYEGFGIPPLEAQACGIPVIVSNIDSLLEVCGDSVLYCNPYDANSIKEKIELLMKSDVLQKKLVLKGYENIQRFSWEKSAKEIIKIFKGLL